MPGPTGSDQSLPPQTGYCFGDDPLLLDDYAWYDANSGKHTHPVGQKKPNAFKLYDMHGNVGEWCVDWLGPYPAEKVRNPTGPDSGIRRVRRGGCWASHALNCRSARRIGVAPECRSPLLGFRIVLVLPEAARPS